MDSYLERRVSALVLSVSREAYWVLSPPGSMSISRVSDILSEYMKLVWENMVIVLKLICQVIGAGQFKRKVRKEHVHMKRRGCSMT